MPKPALTGVKLTKKTIHVLKSDEKPRATKLKLTLNTDAKVVIKVKRTKKIHGKTVKAKVTRSLKAGKSAIRLTSKVGAKKLPPGHLQDHGPGDERQRAPPDKTLKLKILP